MNKHHNIFRPTATQRYWQGQDLLVLPRFVAPHTFRYAWCLLVLLTLGALVVWSARVPVYASGLAVAIQPPETLQPTDHDVVLAVFLPHEYHGRIQLGQTLFTTSLAAGVQVGGSIIALEPEVISPAEAYTRYQLTGGWATAVAQPVTVALASWETPAAGAALAAGLPPAAMIGARYDVAVEVGSQRVVSLLPLIGPLFDKMVHD